MEVLNKNLELEENKLDDLDQESQNDIEPNPQQLQQQPTPPKFQDGEQEISFKDLSIHFTNSNNIQACEMFMWLFQNLKNPPKSAPTYAQ